MSADLVSVPAAAASAAATLLPCCRMSLLAFLSRWLQLLVEVGRQQQTCLAGSHAALQLQDSCCTLLASLSRSQATSQALLASTQLRQSVLQLLHGVLRRCAWCSCWGGQSGACEARREHCCVRWHQHAACFCTLTALGLQLHQHSKLESGKLYVHMHL